MVPSYKWFPMNLPERAVWYKNFNHHMQLIGASLGIGPAELDSLNKDTENIVFIASGTVSMEAFMASFRQYRKDYTEGKPGDPTPAFPPMPTLTLPHPNQPPGAFTRLDNLVQRIRLAPGFTEATEALLGIAIQKPMRPALSQMEPRLKVSVKPGNVIEVKFVRGYASGIEIDFNADDTGWIDAGRFFKSPAVFTVPKSESGAPRNVQIRAQYLDGNTPVGKFSAMPTVQTVP